MKRFPEGEIIVPVREFAELIETRVYAFALRLIQLTIEYLFFANDDCARCARIFVSHLVQRFFFFSLHKLTTDPKGESLKQKKTHISVIGAWVHHFLLHYTRAATHNTTYSTINPLRSKRKQT